MFHKKILGLPWMSYPKTALTHVPEEEYTVPIGRARIAREGRDATIITAGLMVHYALEAADKLVNEGISVEVVDLRTIKPLDRETIVNSIKKTGRVLVVDEDYLSFGLTGEVAAIVSEEAHGYLKAPFKRLAVPDVPIPYSRPLEQFVIPSTDKIVSAIEDLMK
ncbi:transketolase C-terminal domain-containing protein [Vulcanisaeta souniana]|nr:transketolase C-terminal domain-containing protein [Vulcanisaeta souniana]